jgi:hypothetical protein
MPPDISFKPAWETSSRPTGEQISDTHSTPTATPGINQHRPWDRLNPCPSKKNQKLNNEQGTEKEHAADDQGAVSAPRRGRGGEGANLHGNF